MRGLKRLAPKTLFGRGLLIVVLPVVMIQIAMGYYFFARHVDNVSKYMRLSLAGEISFLTYLMIRQEERAESIVYLFDKQMGISASFTEGKTLPPAPTSQPFPEFRSELAKRIDLPFIVSNEKDALIIQVQMNDGVLKLLTTVKRLESRTIDIYVWWMVGASALFLMIALLFLRNQVRPIRELAEAAEKFGRGQETPDFKPSGAAEVRRAGFAFLLMRERIARQIKTRTEMLAGISHDLRTPLTRMKLQIEMLGNKEAVKELKDDVTQMEHMVREYLDFARGASGEETAKISLQGLLHEIREDYARSGQQLALGDIADTSLNVRPQAFRRMLTNIINNAFRYGNSCTVHTQPFAANKIDILVDDNGKGIPEAKREAVFRPFVRLDSSRNLNETGVGLGLTVARDVARSHGGDILLDNAPQGGLRVIIRLPV